MGQIPRPRKGRCGRQAGQAHHLIAHPRLQERQAVHAGRRCRAWRGCLDELGYDVDVDGLYGPGSTAVAKKFQDKAGLLVTGSVDKAIWAKGNAKK
ncbi:peptidoglycan-binding domain-containing protein [Nonomuraea ceibae]|uniref:peptidoglycan-binding domain-containing protein n=1 Tax=Nonomuraea ceibae TaxID=1935170 RepID=UPI001C601BB3